MTTNQFRSINFLNQTGNFDYDINLTVNNSTGYFEFGLSGNKNLKFKGQYGKIKDKNDNIIIGYVPNQELNIKGSIYSGKESLTIEDNLIYSNISNTGCNFNYFYLNPIGCSLDYNFSLSGGYTDFSSRVTTTKIKDFNIIVDSANNPFITKTLTGVLVNQNPNLEIKIFSGVVASKTDTYNLYGFPITFNNTGTYLIDTNTGISASINDSFDVLFYTNFGNITKTVTISGEVIPLFFLFFDVTPAISGFPNIKTGYDQIFVNNPINYSLSYGFVSGANVQLNLTYISGLTGDVTGFLSATGKFDGTLSGYLTGSGYLSNYVATGITFSGGNDFLNTTQFITDSGFYAQQFKVATGYSEGNYVVTGYGLGSGYIYGNVFATGKIRVLVTGQVPYVGGTAVSVNPYPFTGSGIAYNQNNSGFIATGIVDGYYPNFASLIYTGELTGIILNSGQYSGKNFIFKPAGDSVPVFSAPYILEATGYESGIGPTGKVNPEFFTNFQEGYYTFTKNFTGTEGSVRVSDDTDIITGYLGIVECATSEKRKYVGISQNIFGDVSGSAYLSSCDTDAFIPSGFIVTGKSNTDATLYILTGECAETGNLDENIPKFVVIRPTGVYELKTQALEVGTNLPFNQQPSFLNNLTGSRTKIFGSGIGYFENVVGDCENLGRWDHLFSANEIKVEKNISDYILNTTNFKIITLEDNGLNYFSDVYFKSTGIFENFNFKLSTANKIIQSSPARDIYYRLILSKKISDTAYSGFYESDFTKLKDDVDFCTGLAMGTYRAKIKYINQDISPTGTPICRIPIQIVNLVDKNYYNIDNIRIFSGTLYNNFNDFRLLGSGYHHQANIFYTKDEVYGTQFLTTTGFTQQYLTDLSRAPVQDYTNFNKIYSNSILQAIEYSFSGLTGWSSSGVKNINIFTNHIALSGVSKNEFLNYIKNIYTSQKIIFNVLNCDYNRNKDNFQSFDSMNEFLKDTATIGGGTYYDCSRISNVDANYSYDNLIPLTNQPVYATCNGFYPDVPGTSTESGKEGVDTIPVPVVPPVIPIVIPPVIPTVPVVVVPPGPVITTTTTTTTTTPAPYGGGGGGGGSPGGPGDGPRRPDKPCDEGASPQVTFSTTSAKFTKNSTYYERGLECLCKTKGILTVKGTVTNTYCKDRKEKMSISVYGQVDSTRCQPKKASGEVEVDVPGEGSANWSVDISVCQPNSANLKKNCPNNPDYLVVIPSRSNNMIVNGNDKQCGCKCPKTKSQIKEECGSATRIIPYYDCEYDFKAYDYNDAVLHNIAVGRGMGNDSAGRPLYKNINKPPWIKTECEECEECDDPKVFIRTVPPAVYSAIFPPPSQFYVQAPEYMETAAKGNLEGDNGHHKSCEPCGSTTDKSLCGGGLRANAKKIIRSTGFSIKCLKAFDLYCKVENGYFDNWGYVYDIHGTAKTTKCDNEGTDDCDLCTKNEVFGPLNTIPATNENCPADMVAAGYKYREAGVNGYAINAPHGGGNGISATVSFFWKPKPEVLEE
jgi:hypothetical protein